MATLKEHQAAMVDLLASGSGIPASASRLAHAMHDVLNLLDTELAAYRRRVIISDIAIHAHADRVDATTPGLNEKALSKREKALKTDSPAKWPPPAEQRVKELENTIRQLKANNAKLKSQNEDLRDDIGAMASKLHTAERQLGCGLRGIIEHQEQSGCRKEDMQVCETECDHDFSNGRFCQSCGEGFRE